MQHKARVTRNKHKWTSLITTTLEDKNKLWPKLKHGLHFYTIYLSLTLNSASASLSGDNIYLGTLNLKLPKIGCDLEFFYSAIQILILEPSFKLDEFHNFRFQVTWSSQFQICKSTQKIRNLKLNFKLNQFEVPVP